MSDFYKLVGQRLASASITFKPKRIKRKRYPRDPEKEREYNRRRELSPRRKEWRKEWDANNRDKILASRRKYHRTHKDQERAYHDEYRKSHADQINKRRREWWAANKGRVNAERQAKRKAKKLQTAT